jgi:hypothetical protein
MIVKDRRDSAVKVLGSQDLRSDGSGGPKAGLSASLKLRRSLTEPSKKAKRRHTLAAQAYRPAAPIKRRT